VKDTRFQFVLVIGLAILLGVLAFFQYKWLGQIGQAEEERLQKRLDLDAQRFAENFNAILQNAYFNFVGENWQYKFLEHYENWQQKSRYPALIKEFMVSLPTGETARFDPVAKQFVVAEARTQLITFQSNFEPIDESNLALTMPIYEQTNHLTMIPRMREKVETHQPFSPLLAQPKILAFLVIRLDEAVIKEQIIPDLTKRYFHEDDYKLSIFSKKQNKTLFQTENLELADASVPLFELVPENLALFVNKELWTTLNRSRVRSQVIFNQRVESKIEPGSSEPVEKFKIQVFGDNQNRIYQRTPAAESGNWILNVQHKSGSLEHYVDTTRRKNLAISFGILGLLGGSIGLIFLSARRAQILAQRQLDFVSAVSHEFRTPIAVIYSAGENLADGVAREGTQVLRYGNLIKGEGKKLSAMVEQILEFAGARSGRKKYDFRETDVKTVIESALADCGPLIAEQQFDVETDIQEDLPLIQADRHALSHAVQNLIINGIKYGNGRPWLKISAKNGGRTVKISVEDKGIGIAKKDLTQIFIPFYRAKDVVDAQIHGNGLGLSLVKQTVEAHHGKITVESEIGVGSHFVIELPPSVKA
jgi:signal transduction histidine kinase